MAEQEVFEQAPDECGRLRLDRPFTAEEARAQDEAHQAIHVENRRQRFAATEADPSLGAGPEGAPDKGRSPTSWGEIHGGQAGRLSRRQGPSRPEWNGGRDGPVSLQSHSEPPGTWRRDLPLGSAL